MRLFKVPDADAPEPFEDLPADRSWFQARSSRSGADFDEEALQFLERAGASVEEGACDVAGIPVDAIVRGRNGKLFLVAAHGSFDDGPQAGLRRTDTLHKVFHRAWMLCQETELPLLVITSHLPEKGKAAQYLRRSAPLVFDVVATTGDLVGFQRLRHYFTSNPPPSGPEPAAWRDGTPQLRLFFPGTS